MCGFYGKDVVIRVQLLFRQFLKKLGCHWCDIAITTITKIVTHNYFSVTLNPAPDVVCSVFWGHNNYFCHPAPARIATFVTGGTLVIVNIIYIYVCNPYRTRAVA